MRGNNLFGEGGESSHKNTDLCGMCWLSFPKDEISMRAWLHACECEGETDAAVEEIMNCEKSKSRPRPHANHFKWDQWQHAASARARPMLQLRKS
jgi:hypothetical protein